VNWLTLPDGEYDVTELISGSAKPSRTAQDLRENGIELTLEPRAAAIFKMEKR
jgi:hypothetical protein